MVVVMQMEQSQSTVYLASHQAVLLQLRPKLQPFQRLVQVIAALGFLIFFSINR